MKYYIIKQKTDDYMEPNNTQEIVKAFSSKKECHNYIENSYRFYFRKTLTIHKVDEKLIWKRKGVKHV